MTHAHSEFEPTGTSTGYSSYSSAMLSGIRSHFLLLGLALTLAAPPAALFAEKGTDKDPPKAPTDKLEKMLHLQKIFHNPFPSNEWVKRLVSCGDTLFMAAGNFFPNSPPAVRIYRLEHAGCKLWADVTPAWKGTPSADQLAMAAFNGKLFVGTDTGEIHWIDPQGPIQLVKEVGAELSSMAVFKGQLYAVTGSTLYRTSDGSQWEDLGSVLSLPSGKPDGVTTLEVFNGYLYLGFGYDVTPPGASAHAEEGIQIWRTADGKNAQLFKKMSRDLTQATPGVISEPVPHHVHAMKAFGGHLYVGSYDGPAGQVMRTNGTPGNWEEIIAAGAGTMPALEVHDGKLYAGLFDYRPNMAGSYILAASANGTQWSTVSAVPVATGTCLGVTALASHVGRLYIGTGDAKLGGEVFELGEPLSLCQIADIDKYSNKSIASSLLFLKNNLTDAKLTTAGTTAGMIDQLGNSWHLLKLPEAQTPQRDKAIGLLQAAKKELQNAQALVDLTAKASAPEREKLLIAGGTHVERAQAVFQQYLAALAEVSQGEAKIEQQPQGQQPASSGKGPGIHGRVFALDESGDLKGIVPGATIEFKNAGGQAVAKVTTNEQGYYKLDLAAGNYQYKVTAAGFKDEDFGRGRQLMLTQGYAIYNFSLVKGKTDPKSQPPAIIPVDLGTLKGHVFEKTTDSKLVGIPGATITLVNPKSIEPPTKVVSRDGDDKERGRYEVVLEAATYRASVVATGFDRFDDPQPIQVEKGKTATRDFILSRVKPPTVPATQGIKGTITLLKPKDGVAKKPAIEVWILPLKGQQSRVKIEPDAKGKYSEKLATGLYEVIAAAEGYRPISSGPRQVYAARFTVVDLTLRPLPPIVTPEPKDITIVAKVFQKEPDGSQGTAIAAATVLFRPEGKRPIDKGRGTTDAKGEVTLTLPAGKYDAVAYKDGFKPEAKKADVTAATPQTYVFLLEPDKAPPTVVTKAKVTFKVLQPDVEFGPTPLPGADVEVMQQNRLVAGGKTTNAGAFATGLLPPATYDVVVAREGFVPARLQIALADKDVHRDVVLKIVSTKPPTEGRLHLWVVEVPAERGKGIGHAQCQVTQKGKRVASGETELDGKYVLPLKYGAYTVEVVHAGYKSRTVEVSIDQPEVRQTVALVADQVQPPPITVAKLHVKVIDGSPSAQPIPAAEVFVLRGNTTMATTHTGFDGQTTFSLKPGAYTVAARKTQYRPEEIQVTVDAKDQYVTIRLLRLVTPLPTPAQLHVRALDDRGRPVSGAHAIVEQGETTLDSAYSGTDGQTTFRLKPGPYSVTVSKAGFKSATFQVTMGLRDTRRDVFLASTGITPPKTTEANLQLAVVEREPRTGYSVPVPGAAVSVLFQGQAIQSGATDAQGRFQVRLKRAQYEVVVAKGGYITAKLPVDLRAGDTSRTVTLVRISKEPPPPPPEQKAWLQIQVLQLEPRLKKNFPLADADVQVRWGGQTVGQGKTDSAGRLSRELRRDLYQVVISKPGYESAQLSVDLRQGNVQREVVLSSKSVTVVPKIDPIIPPPAKKVSLTMRISELMKGKPMPVAGASVMLQQAGKAVFQGNSNPGGTFYAGNLSPGNYRVIVTKFGFHTFQVDTAIMDDAVRPVTLQRSMVIK